MHKQDREGVTAAQIEGKERDRLQRWQRKACARAGLKGFVKEGLTEQRIWNNEERMRKSPKRVGEDTGWGLNRCYTGQYVTVA